LIQEQEQIKKPAPAHDDFDWTADKRDLVIYDQSTREKLTESYDKTFTDITENVIIKGTVVAITPTDVVLNIGFKSDGLISMNEFKDEPIKIGDIIEVYVMKKEDLNGQLQLSRKNARLMKAWDAIVDAFTTEKIVQGLVTSKTKGGLIVDLFGMETFLPGSQIDVKPITDYDQFVGKAMDFKVVKINETIKNAVVSHKALIESDLELQRAEIISKLEKGQVLEGTIKNITDFGAFIDLGGVDGLLYITDISWGRINHPTEVLHLNQHLNVVVLEFDDEKKRISLGLKQLTPHPWDVLTETIQIGSVVKGKIVNVEDYGAFLELTPGVEGLIHISEVSWSNQPINSREHFKVGAEFDAKVMTIDRAERKMSLSLKQLSQDPWNEITETYPISSRHTGLVKNITPFGVFVELSDGIGGMIHISDLSWTKRYNHPNEFTKVGSELTVVILDIDKENRKLSLGHKQLEEDPWDTFATLFPVGSVHEATLIHLDDKGGVVLLPYGLEAYSPKRHLKKEDGTFVKADEKLPFKVIEFDRGDKKILVSHTKSHEVSAAEPEGTADDKKKKTTERKSTRKTVQEVNLKMEKTTLGDLDVLSDLKEKMNKKSAKAEKAEKTEEMKDEE